ncbi:protein kinase domain-containing protein [Bythopirellula polymerisocia]|uniref:Serine/threonine-protein kinase PknB n=1 Tax=Bythopirellula polymerisocia TaxID=2528003 RepID=A0A5C6CKW8_9BACT|nr:protein kinase [Bythopirellula polymerisocia]TWU24705.1 Serine/threonine-protein kinase PknB [Bythopirellula polymerisocia]
MAELKTFLFTDICRSVDLKNEMIGRSVTERDMAFIQQILMPHRERIEAHLEEMTGRVVSTAGDGHFLVFSNTIQAAIWTAEVQKSHLENPIETPGGGQVEVRISMHVGVPQVDPTAPDNFVGKSVDYASRLNDYATGGQILVSRSVMAILDDIGLEGISFHLHGRRHLKGIGHVEVHELLYDDHGPRPLRQQPASHSDRQWTVVPTMGAGQEHGGRDSAVASTLQLKQVGNYELESLLGSGGMGDVYKGRHTQFGRLRAIKVIKPQYVAAGNEEIIRRFYQEIKAVGALEHRNIVVAIDSSSPTDRLHYLVMEYIEGVSVHDLVEQLGHLSVPDACEIVRQAARGLQFIHRNEMVHRDIKPSNLMLTLVNGDGVASQPAIAEHDEPVEGVVKILDLGLALLAGDAQDRLTRFDNKAMGTGMYMSPEQWKTTSVDIRADIYSLGCTLYHLLAGKPPFMDSDLRPEKAHEKSKLPPIRTNNVPRKLWDIIEKMVAKKPEDRYATPAEVAAELTSFCVGSDLVELVRGYLEPGSEHSSHRYTRIDSGAGMDTWLSRASHLYPTRRWILRRGLPFILVLGAFAALSWTAYQARQRTIANAMQQARDTLPLAAETAANAIGNFLTLRFEILQQAATDVQLIEMIQKFSPTEARTQLESYPLAEWIKEHRQDNMDSAPSDSWFINDIEGIQIARHPLVERATKKPEDSFLENYGYRDYFHGLGKDLPNDSEKPIEPIQSPNLSAVYMSSTTGKLKVAFSVPVWSKPSDEARKVIAVLSMSVELGAFEVLNKNVQQGKDIVLVDLREDMLDKSAKTPQRGLILNHPLLPIWKEKEHPPRVSPEVLAAMEKGEDHFIAGYHDPLSINPGVTYWGVFEPVAYTINEVLTDTSKAVLAGWNVLVQSPAIQ